LSHKVRLSRNKNHDDDDPFIPTHFKKIATVNNSISKATISSSPSKRKSTISFMNSFFRILAIFLLLADECGAFATFSSREISFQSGTAVKMNDNDDLNGKQNACGRRAFLGFASVGATMLGVSSPVNAKDLFGSNPLTNNVLEQVSLKV
jgi:hypothetical protein